MDKQSEKTSLRKRGWGQKCLCRLKGRTKLCSCLGTLGLCFDKESSTKKTTIKLELINKYLVSQLDARSSFRKAYFFMILILDTIK